MYLYSFSLYAGYDRVFLLKEPLSGNPGDLFTDGEGLFLLLGEEISFPELITHQLPPRPLQKVESWLLSQKTLELLHRMVYQRYSPYKTVIKLFLDKEIPSLLAKKPIKSLKPKKAECTLAGLQLSTDKDQILVIFPDLRSRQNLIHTAKNTLELSSLDTAARKNLNRRHIKKGAETLILATGSEIFQDFANLKAIYLLEPQKRYYAAQQDPRYKVLTVAQKLAEIHGATLHILNSEDLRM